MSKEHHGQALQATKSALRLGCRVGSGAGLVGGVLAVGAEQVSAGERQMLEQVRAALGAA
jgi:hypothetical protein